MKKMNLEQMENLQGGAEADKPIDWCLVGKGISGIGAGLLLAGATFTCGLSAAAYATIVAATMIYC